LVLNKNRKKVSKSNVDMFLIYKKKRVEAEHFEEHGTVEKQIVH
jgi:hypothetical protein